MKSRFVTRLSTIVAVGCLAAVSILSSPAQAARAMSSTLDLPDPRPTPTPDGLIL